MSVSPAHAFLSVPLSVPARTRQQLLVVLVNIILDDGTYVQCVHQLTHRGHTLHQLVVLLYTCHYYSEAVADISTCTEKGNPVINLLLLMCYFQEALE